MEPDRDEIITLRAWAQGLNRGVEVRTRLRTWLHPLKIAMLSELDDNPGPSVTNAAEDIWSHVEHLLGVDLLDGRWSAIEHYDHGGCKPTYDLVLFSGRHNGRLSGVQWRPGGEIIEAAEVLV